MALAIAINNVFYLCFFILSNMYLIWFIFEIKLFMIHYFWCFFLLFTYLNLFMFNELASKFSLCIALFCFFLAFFISFWNVCLLI